MAAVNRQPRPDDVRNDTYRYLRLSLVVVVFLLGVAIVSHGIATGCLVTSISGYYWTSVQSVFVAALCAIGTALIVYQGGVPADRWWTGDNLWLDIAGVCAFGVAFVPTRLPVENVCDAFFLDATGRKVFELAETGLLALAITALATTILALFLANKPADKPRRRQALLALGLVIVAGTLGTIAWFTYIPADDPPTAADRLRYAHYGFAIVFFLAITWVVWLNSKATSEIPGRSRYVATYRWLAIGMGGSLVVGAAILWTDVFSGFEHEVLVVEAVLLGWFAVFWSLQTAQLWDYRDLEEMRNDAEAG